jgi:ABC-type transport system involved in Fe-S cluster assembly fused permease/ATPase subunit
MLQDNNNYYIDDCKNRSEFHRNNANNALKWFNLLNIVSTIIMAISGLTMTIMSVLKIDEGVIAISSGVFTCISIVFSRVSQSYNFQAISIQHHHISDSFLELIKDFTNNQGNSDVYLLLTNKYIEIIQRSHIPHVKQCVLLECC